MCQSVCMGHPRHDRWAAEKGRQRYVICCFRAPSADRRDAKGQMELFTEDANFLVYMDSRSTEPTQHIRGRSALAPVFDELNTYVATMHFNGQSTTTLDGERASGVAYCLAHHVKVDGPERSMMTAAIRYLDTFVKHDGTWYFSERKLMVDWTETRRLNSAQ